VGGDAALDAGAEDLDGDVAPVPQACPVHDGERGLPEGDVVDVGEHPVDGTSGGALELGEDLGERHGRSAVETGAELGGDLLAEQRLGAGNDLRVLEEGAAE